MSDLSAAIDKALTDTPQPKGDTAVDLPVPPIKDKEEKVETKVETKDEKVETKTDDADEELQARQLFKALKDPSQAPAIIDFIARQAGYAKVETKADVREAKDEVVEYLKESLGTEFEFLADKLAPAITKILELKLEQHTQDIRETLNTQKLNETANEAKTELERLSKEYLKLDVLPAEYDARINELIDEMPPAANTSATKYMRNLFNIVLAEKGVPKVSASNKDRADKNRTDAPSRLASERISTDNIPVAIPKDKMSLTDSIKDAIEKAQSALSEK